MIEIFPQHVYEKNFLQFDKNYLSQLQASIELIRRGNINGREISNTQFGWQSDNLPQNGPFEILTQQITKNAYKFCENLKNFNFSKVELINMWANINYKGDINWPHNHAGDISGVFYVDVPKNSGDLVLNSYAYNSYHKLSNYLLEKHHVQIKSKNNLLVLFDSNCYHCVTKNLTKKPRISISFNIKIYD